MTRALKVLCVHGVGGHPPGAAWEQQDWAAPLREQLGADTEVEFVHLDSAFDSAAFTLEQALQAFKLLAGGLLRPTPRDVGPGLLDRTLAMVGQWAADAALRRRLRKRLADAIATHRPQLVLAHSLGSLVAFDCFNDPDTAAAAQGLHLIVIGSQIGNRAVWPCFGGRLEMPAQLLRFTQLYRSDDPVFTTPIPLHDPRFACLPVEDGFWLPWRHAVSHYLPSLPRVRGHWGDWLPDAGARRQLQGALQAAARSLDGVPLRPRLAASPRAARRRALLVGISDYANPNTAPLMGCVNDAWLMSALLQESGFEAGEIRMVLNERATADGLQQRLDWLVDDARPGDTCVFYYSGHGAQLPVYDAEGQHVVGLHETLVPHDFDWSLGRALTDQQFAAFYSQLPYGLNFLGVFDCCHSGGMTRGGAQRIRGLEPPDDVRHRMLKWNATRQMWLPRDFPSPNPEHARKLGGRPEGPQRLGQALALRGAQGVKGLKKLAQRYGHLGPYMPTLLYACGDRQFSYEYEHGPISHGAYTYCLVKRLRAARAAQRSLNFGELVAAVRAELAELGYAQTPQLAAPTHIQQLTVPLTA